PRKTTILHACAVPGGRWAVGEAGLRQPPAPRLAGSWTLRTVPARGAARHSRRRYGDRRDPPASIGGRLSLAVDGRGDAPLPVPDGRHGARPRGPEEAQRAPARRRAHAPAPARRPARRPGDRADQSARV